MQRHIPQPHPLILLTALLLFVAAMGTRGLTFDAIWYDEWRSMFYIGSLSVTEIDAPHIPGTLARVVNESDALNPPAYYLLLSVWTSLTGVSVFTARYLSLLLGALTVAHVYRVGRDVASPAAGLAAAGVLAGMALFTVFLHEIRAYALAMLITTMHLWWYWRCLRTNATRLDYAVFTLITAVMIHTHYTAALMGAGTFAHHIYYTLRHRRKWGVFGLYVLAGLSALPWVGVVLSADALDTVQDRDNTAMSTRTLVTTMTTHLGNGFVWLPLVPVALALGRARLLWFYTLGGVIAYVGLNAVVPFACCIRYTLVLYPALALLIGVGLARWRWLGVIVVAVWLGTGIDAARDLYFSHTVTNTPRWHIPYDVMRAAILPELRDDDDILMLLPGGIATFPHEGVMDYYFPDNDITLLRNFSTTTEAAALDVVRGVIAGDERVWVAYKASWPSYHREAIFALLDAEMSACGTVHRSAHMDVSLYTHGGCPD